MMRGALHAKSGAGKLSGLHSGTNIIAKSLREGGNATFFNGFSKNMLC
ncbi:Hypothetical protein GbCGDNIH3_5053 [Granulibacter bethesdensis]|uniref:Uncharacterized protein n=1 Tax=Granulibacter bethesdensis TaxID=364410 RepID=A0AAN0RF09_9PROT|nr:Hypothetical protein GbCGDNIH3_5053 [Granulibacter bethesdensis]APH60183.1 Hypothetical protein GbCGDNIH7_5053 [Granulibacter bethesdensis]